MLIAFSFLKRILVHVPFTCIMHFFLGMNHVDGVRVLLFWLPYGLFSFIVYLKRKGSGESAQYEKYKKSHVLTLIY